jgi:ABC-type branched-subunit amino acid transport system ATPase component
MTAPQPPLLEARALRKSFGAVRALDGADFELRRGEIHALVGDNGAGKSTLIKVFSGVHLADAGTLAIDGVEVRFGSPPGHSMRPRTSSSAARSSAAALWAVSGLSIEARCARASRPSCSDSGRRSPR